jgi:HEAT repeat protein
MPVTMEQVINQLDREEPDYGQAAQLGSEALPHLITLIQGENLGLAAKAASLAGIINVGQSAAVLEIAAQHPEPVVRVAAAASAKNLTSIPTSLAMHLLNDSDAGVRKWVLNALEVRHPPGIKTKVEEIMKNDLDMGLRDRARQIINRLP